MGCAQVNIYSHAHAHAHATIYMVIILALQVVVIETLFGSYIKVNAAAIDMSSAILLKVDQSGNGDFKKIQDAIDAVPSNNSQIYFISVKPGTYRYILFGITKAWFYRTFSFF